ncbi:MAG: AprI/Inh family metalloprotease inhibitor [Alphaproteobacteria bacterium]|nr:AprI/Inh family metalloprotease inhibitor [Alphaproteobacteria bacterium]MBU6471023.1 AprI/Inh family metalloprotease inhibitor [Alphaproteobacteria bacterium]MDE2012215.1 AprI/Inh family metalloprotease inhibitor [Alphaproteobacteria bacterium]MDE2074860.1 AprI/Inh family metalloprotease inhibitor [Alphaproteobacteria bacterium]MDE2351482.1 AprI/Inh family metalloprotease inhibitor [Alphaproteobacteria bacterium]
MKGISTFALATGLALAWGSLAHAESPVTGKWSYKIGAGAPCALTFTAGTDQTSGDVETAQNCNDGLSAVARWRQVGSKLNLISPSGDLVAVLSPHDGGYAGEQVGGGRKIALSR